jgi:hypothetical protein
MIFIEIFRYQIRSMKVRFWFLSSRSVHLILDFKPFDCLAYLRQSSVKNYIRISSFLLKQFFHNRQNDYPHFRENITLNFSG